MSDGKEETSLPDAGVSRQWMIANATEIRNRGIQIFAVGSDRSNEENLKKITSNESHVIITNQLSQHEDINRFYNSLVTQICPEAPTRPVPSKFNWCMVECEGG